MLWGYGGTIGLLGSRMPESKERQTEVRVPKIPFKGTSTISFPSTTLHLPHSYHRDWAPNLQDGSQRMAAWRLKAEFPSQGGWRSGEAPVMGAVLFMQHEYVLEI